MWVCGRWLLLMSLLLMLLLLQLLWLVGDEDDLIVDCYACFIVVFLGNKRNGIVLFKNFLKIFFLDLKLVSLTLADFLAEVSFVYLTGLVWYGFGCFFFFHIQRIYAYVCESIYYFILFLICFYLKQLTTVVMNWPSNHLNNEWSLIISFWIFYFVCLFVSNYFNKMQSFLFFFFYK